MEGSKGCTDNDHANDNVNSNDEHHHHVTRDVEDDGIDDTIDVIDRRRIEYLIEGSNGKIVPTTTATASTAATATMFANADSHANDTTTDDGNEELKPRNKEGEVTSVIKIVRLSASSSQSSESVGDSDSVPAMITRRRNMMMKMMKSFDVLETSNDQLQQRLPQYLLPYFQLVVGYEEVDMDAIKVQVLPVLERGCSTTSDGRGMCPHISFRSMRDSAAEGNVECHTVTVDRLGTSSSSSTGRHHDDDDVQHEQLQSQTLKLYYDDSAHLKHRPVNQYAMALIERYDGSMYATQDGDKDDDNSSGKLTIHGDVFVVACSSDDNSSYDQGTNPRVQRFVSCHPGDIIQLLHQPEQQ
jgi:hypothetical protein